ncbi:aminoglycoside resistance protein [Ensifer adhaerens]|uniref:Aminoglycoside resistance protein n=1 Tax=Ensifer adhaerens TaxID=106592 RepID=A0A0L8BPX3_ENSAD|nr:aminoglycoside phosphotransferase family protein [Ensifer adhaerens]KOF16741.1 aminoglycoside resistance protein [Ensifer adhaerens]
MDDQTLDSLRKTILAGFPDLAGSAFSLATAGWHSTAVDVDDRLIFKFPRHEIAERALIKEASLLSAIRPNVSMAVPDLKLHEGPPLFSVHGKLKGEHLVTADYDKLSETERRGLGRDLGQFYAELHRLDDGQMAAAGAGPVEQWQTVETIRRKALPALPAALHALAAETVEAFERLGPDPYGSTYGFFDGHGWNMAFDHAERRLNGVYDFADSGIGPLHREFIYSCFISPDLTARIVETYEDLTGLALDRRRIAVLTGMHRLSELAELADDPEHAPTMLRSVETWATTVARAN